MDIPVIIYQRDSPDVDSTQINILSLNNCKQTAIMQINYGEQK